MGLDMYAWKTKEKDLSKDNLELDELASQMCASKITNHYDFGVLASRIAISNNHKNTSPSFQKKVGAVL